MIVCPNCDYKTGWTHRGGESNKLISPPEGDFYELVAQFQRVESTRFHGDKNKMKTYGCPKCKSVFISEGEVYDERNYQ